MLLAELLRSGAATNQEALAQALANAGEPASQGTVSRDLAAIGAVRGPAGYQLPRLTAANGVGVASANELAAVVRRHVVSIEPAHATVVIGTAPGHASIVGAAIDRRPPDGVVGTVAGDDTIFLAARSPDIAASVAEDLRTMRDGADA